MKVDVAGVAGTPICVASEDGHKVHDAIADVISKGETISISFANVRRLTTAFLNAAIGQLYNEFSEDAVRRGLVFEDIDPQSLSLLKKVVDRAKEFYRMRRT